MGSTKPKKAKRKYYDCGKCPAYCCSVYELVQVYQPDIARLARHFRVGVRTAVKKFTKTYEGERILRQKADPMFGRACEFLDVETRRCTVYEARPDVCRAFPAFPRCGFYDLLSFERRHEADESVVPLVAITFHDRKK